MAQTRREFVKGAAAAAAALAAALAGLKPSTARAAPLRPPGALAEEEFLSRCIRCGRCADACPNRAISAFTESARELFSIGPGSGELGTPVLFPRQKACNLCMGAQGEFLRCTDACPTGALARLPKTPEAVLAGVRIGRAVVDTNLCYSFNSKSCGVCIRACPFEGRALRAGPFEKPLVDASVCVGCGLCERACIRYPQAISVVRRA